MECEYEGLPVMKKRTAHPAGAEDAVDFSAFNLEDGEDEPSAKEVAAVLRELCPSATPTVKPKQTQRPSASSSPPQRPAPSSLPQAPEGTVGIGALVGARVEAYQRAATAATARGDLQGFGRLSQQATELQQVRGAARVEQNSRTAALMPTVHVRRRSC